MTDDEVERLRGIISDLRQTIREASQWMVGAEAEARGPAHEAEIRAFQEKLRLAGIEDATHPEPPPGWTYWGV